MRKMADMTNNSPFALREQLCEIEDAMEYVDDGVREAVADELARRSSELSGAASIDPRKIRAACTDLREAVSSLICGCASAA
jgi:hypothetical protein